VSGVARHALLGLLVTVAFAAPQPSRAEPARLSQTPDTLKASPPHVAPRTLPGNPPRPIRVAPRKGSSLPRQLLRLQQLLKRDPESALKQLERLHLENPTHHQLRLILGRAYRLTGRLDRAEETLRGLHREFPESSGYRGELIQTLYRAGKDDEADGLLNTIYRRPRPNAGHYEEAAALLMGVNRMRRVEQVYREGLEVLPREDERGRLRMARRLFELHNLESAPDRILRLLAELQPSFETPDQRIRLFAHAERFLGEAEQPELLRPLADSLATASGGRELAEVLREIYLGAGDHMAFAEQVLVAARTAPRPETWFQEEGLRCLEDGRGDPARRRSAARRLFEAGLEESDLKPGLRAELRLRLVGIRLDEDAAARLAGDPPTSDEVDEMRQMLAALRRENPASLAATRALIEELRFLRERLGDVEGADALLRAWFLEPERARGREIAATLELELGENLMAARRTDEAREHYASILAGPRSNSATAWASFRLAQILVLDGDKVAAQDSLSSLAKLDPGSVLANDALDLALLLAESAAWPATVQAFLDGSLALEYSGRLSAAAERLMAFAAEFPADAASPALLFRAGELHLRALQGAEALAAWTLLADEHADDFRAPQGLERAARLAYRLGDRARARRLLERILLEHPDFPLRPGLRDLQDRLEEDA